ncbi:MAG: high frequency lysogenization protein HflD [Kangiellaceae bacterium]|nr:high frequency lysogenization protein HflD [Kangiellaceae bacterium]
MSNYSFSDSVIALAGICQALECVRKIAKTGEADAIDMEVMFESVLKIDAQSTEEVYRNHKYLHTGMKVLTEQLSGSKTESDFGRYLVGVLNLQKRFMSDHNMQEIMQSRLAQTNRLFNYQQSINHEVIEQLANIYKDTISSYSTKIQVTGNGKYLEQAANQAKIRALLLAAIRSAVLWQQVGGKKRQFLLSKNRIVETAKALMA